MRLAQSLAKFARSPQGKKVFREAARLSKDPKTRAKIDEARRSFQSGRRPKG